MKSLIKFLLLWAIIALMTLFNCQTQKPKTFYHKTHSPPPTEEIQKHYTGNELWITNQGEFDADLDLYITTKNEPILYIDQELYEGLFLVTYKENDEIMVAIHNSLPDPYPNKGTCILTSWILYLFPK